MTIYHLKRKAKVRIRINQKTIQLNKLTTQQEYLYVWQNYVVEQMNADYSCKHTVLIIQSWNGFFVKKIFGDKNEKSEISSNGFFIDGIIEC